MGQGEFLVKLLWVVKVVLVQLVEKVDRHLVHLLSCCSLSVYSGNSQ